MFIIDDSKALTRAMRRTFGRDTPRSARKSAFPSDLSALCVECLWHPARSQRCQLRKARNITERLPKHLNTSVRATLRQAWQLDDAEKAESLIHNLSPDWNRR